MTTVRYAPRRGLLSLSGHAGAGEKGSDLVCAALSILAETAAALPGAKCRRGAGRMETEAAPAIPAAPEETPDEDDADDAWDDEPEEPEDDEFEDDQEEE